MIIPNIWKNNPVMFQENHQPDQAMAIVLVILAMCCGHGTDWSLEPETKRLLQGETLKQVTVSACIELFDKEDPQDVEYLGLNI